MAVRKNHSSLTQGGLQGKTHIFSEQTKTSVAERRSSCDAPMTSHTHSHDSHLTQRKCRIVLEVAHL